jgi:hypothetical protein
MNSLIQGRWKPKYRRATEFSTSSQASYIIFYWFESLCPCLRLSMVRQRKSGTSTPYISHLTPETESLLLLHNTDFEDSVLMEV